MNEMKIPAADLKKCLKPLSPVRTESYQVGEHGVSAQDADVWCISESPLSGLGGTFSINGKKLTQVVNRMSKDIEIEKSDKFISLRSAKAKVDLEIQEIKPLKIPETPSPAFSTKSDIFKQSLSLAAESASTNKSAPYGGVVQVQNLPLSLEDNMSSGYRIVGTNGTVFTVVSVDDCPTPEFKFLLNLSAASIVRLIDSSGDWGIGESNSHIWIQAGTTKILASKPVQAYPNFDKLLANPSKLIFGFDPEEWISALKTVEPLIDETVDQGGITLHFADNVVVFKTDSIGSSAQDEAPYEQLEPDPIFEPVTASNLRVNAKYLSQFLSKASGKSSINLVDRASPVKMVSGNMMTLMMPMPSGKTTK